MYLGGSIIDEESSHSGLRMANSIIWGNTAATCGGIYLNNYEAADMDYTVNCIIQSVDGQSFPTNPVKHYEYDLGSNNNMIVDPQFADDGSYRLKDTSPGIDAGTALAYVIMPPPISGIILQNLGYGMYKSYATSTSGTYSNIDREVSDLDGNSRLVNGHYDIGAYERQDVGSISGTVTDQSGTPLSGAAVTVSGCGYTATTAADGTYTVLAVKAGPSHTVTAAFNGYPNATVSNVNVTANQTTPSVNMVVDSAATLQSIAITTPATKLVYTVGDSLDISGLEITGTYSDGSKKVEIITAANITGFNSEAEAAEQELTITVGDKICSYTVQISADKVDECFIATAAFGSKFQPAVILLRHFRDQYLLTNRLGSAFVKFYYHYSPPIAQFISKNETLKALVRFLLVPFISFVYLVYHPLIGVTTMVFGIIIILYARKRRFHLFLRNI
jgi:hypothetical protein